MNALVLGGAIVVTRIGILSSQYKPTRVSPQPLANFTSLDLSLPTPICVSQHQASEVRLPVSFAFQLEARACVSIHPSQHSTGELGSVDRAAPKRGSWSAAWAILQHLTLRKSLE